MKGYLDENTNVNVLQQIPMWWLNIRLDIISGVASFFIAALAAGAPGFIPIAYLGLGLQQSFSITCNNWLKLK